MDHYYSSQDGWISERNIKGKRKLKKTEYDATYTEIKSVQKMLCSLPTYVIKINMHGTINPN